MLKLFVLFAVIAVMSLFTVCGIRNNQANNSGLIDVSKVTEIKVKILNTKTSGEELFKTISGPADINNIVNYANKNVVARSSFRSDLDKVLKVEDRSTQVDLSFYQSGEYLGNLGLGFFDDDKYFIKYRQSGKSKVAVISSQQKKELLDLIGLSEERFNSLLTN